MIVKGHGLLREGASHDENGSYLGRYTNRTGGGVSVNGYGFCSCGAKSSLLESTAARRRWHNAHKAAVLNIEWVREHLSVGRR